MILIALLAAGAALQGTSTAPPPAVALVRSLYRHEAPPEHVGRFFARDLATAYRKDTGKPGEVGEIDFDWRYGAQDTEITELKVEAVHLRPGMMPMADRGEVKASFRNFGKPYEVTYRVCRRTDGAWRIADVSSHSRADDAWDLRVMLKLDPDKVRC